MTRTKLNKRNRDVQVEDKVHECELLLEADLNEIDNEMASLLSTIDSELNILLLRMPDSLANIKFRDIAKLNLKKFADWQPPVSTPHPNVLDSHQYISTLGCDLGTLGRSRQLSNPNDEGYLTEESGASNIQAVSAIGGHSLRSLQKRRDNGPLNSAKARRRRSQSSGPDLITSTLTRSVSTMNHMSRNKLRTPMSSRPKALSSERCTNFQTPAMVAPPSVAVMRWPKKGELVVSMHGSPVVAQMAPNSFANVNIPLKNGMISVLPNEISELKPDVINTIGEDTIKQIKTLSANLDFIMELVNSGNK